MSDNFDWKKLLDVEGLVDTGPPKAPASIPFMITQGQKGRLRALGYADAVILTMTPEEAYRLLDLSK